MDRSAANAAAPVESAPPLQVAPPANAAAPVESAPPVQVSAPVPAPPPIQYAAPVAPEPPLVGHGSIRLVDRSLQLPDDATLAAEADILELLTASS